MQAGTLVPEVALLNALLIPDVFPVLAAAQKALIAKSRDSLTTRTLHSEIVYNYSGSKHISESLKRGGISDSTTYILAARFGATSDEHVIVEQEQGLLRGSGHLIASFQVFKYRHLMMNSHQLNQLTRSREVVPRKNNQPYISDLLII